MTSKLGYRYKFTKCVPLLFFKEPIFRWSVHPFNFIVFFAHCDSFSWHIPCWQVISSCFRLFGDGAILFSVSHCSFPWACVFLHNPCAELLNYRHLWVGCTNASAFGEHVLFSGCFGFVFSNFIHFWFLSFLISTEGKIALNLPFTRWPLDFKESTHIKIPFLCHTTLIEMLILWRENHW